MGTKSLILELNSSLSPDFWHRTLGLTLNRPSGDSG